MSQQLLPCGLCSESIKAWMSSVTNSMTDSESLENGQTHRKQGHSVSSFHPWRGPGMRCGSYRINLLSHQEGQQILATSVLPLTFSFISMRNDRWELYWIPASCFVPEPLLNTSWSFWIFLNRKGGFSPFLYFASEIMAWSETHEISELILSIIFILTCK